MEGFSVNYLWVNLLEAFFLRRMAEVLTRRKENFSTILPSHLLITIAFLKGLRLFSMDFVENTSVYARK